MDVVSEDLTPREADAFAAEYEGKLGFQPTDDGDYEMHLVRLVDLGDRVRLDVYPVGPGHGIGEPVCQLVMRQPDLFELVENPVTPNDEEPA